jgi:hypothetical protein
MLGSARGCAVEKWGPGVENVVHRLWCAAFVAGLLSIHLILFGFEFRCCVYLKRQFRDIGRRM